MKPDAGPVGSSSHAVVKVGTGPYTTIAQQIADEFSQYRIPEEEQEKNEEALKRFKEDDETRFQEARNKDIQAYVDGNHWALRTLAAIKRKGRYKPNLTEDPSKQTELYASLVELQDAFERGAELFQDLPDVYARMEEDYLRLTAEQEELERIVEEGEEALRVMPERLAMCDSIEARFNSFDELDEAQRANLYADVAKATGYELERHPSLAVPDVQEWFLEDIDAVRETFDLEQVTREFERARKRLDRTNRQIEVLEEQGQQLMRGWKPALDELGRIRDTYDEMRRYAPAAKSILGMLDLRTQTVGLIARADEVMERTRQEIAEGMLLAEVVEELHKPEGGE